MNDQQFGGMAKQRVRREREAREAARELMKMTADIVPGTVVVAADGQVFVWGKSQWEPFLDDQGNPVTQKAMPWTEGEAAERGLVPPSFHPGDESEVVTLREADGHVHDWRQGDSSTSVNYHLDRSQPESSHTHNVSGGYASTAANESGEGWHVHSLDLADFPLDSPKPSPFHFESF